MSTLPPQMGNWHYWRSRSWIMLPLLLLLLLLRAPRGPSQAEASQGKQAAACAQMLTVYP